MNIAWIIIKGIASYVVSSVLIVTVVLLAIAYWKVLLVAGVLGLVYVMIKGNFS